MVLGNRLRCWWVDRRSGSEVSSSPQFPPLRLLELQQTMLSKARQYCLETVKSCSKIPCHWIHEQRCHWAYCRRQEQPPVGLQQGPYMGEGERQEDISKAYVSPYLCRNRGFRPAAQDRRQCRSHRQGGYIRQLGPEQQLAGMVVHISPSPGSVTMATH